MEKVRYEEMFPHELKQALKNNPTAYLPLGSLEWHGHRNILGLDSLKAWKICQKVAKKVGGVVFPPLYLGYDSHADSDPQRYQNKQFDCYHIGIKDYQKLLEQYFKDMIHIGFKKILVLAGHYPNKRLDYKPLIKFKDTKIVIGTEADFVEGEEGDHAAKWETSLMMVLYPNLVDFKLMKAQKDPLLGVRGIDPRKSSIKYGKEILGKIIKGIVKRLEN